MQFQVSKFPFFKAKSANVSRLQHRDVQFNTFDLETAVNFRNLQVKRTSLFSFGGHKNAEIQLSTNSFVGTEEYIAPVMFFPHLASCDDSFHLPFAFVFKMWRNQHQHIPVYGQSRIFEFLMVAGAGGDCWFWAVRSRRLVDIRRAHV